MQYKDFPHRILTSGLLAVGLVLVGCSSKEDTYTPTPDQAQVSFVHAAWPQSATTLQFSVDDGAAVGLTYGLSSGYIGYAVGSHTLKVNGTSVAVNGISPSFVKDAYYSCFAVPSASSTTTSITLVRDDLTLPASGMARVRLLNLAGGMPIGTQLAQAVTSSSGTTYTVLANDSGAFSDFAPGVLSLVLLDANNQLITTVGTGSKKYESGRIYTVLTTGDRTSSNSAAQLKAVTLVNR